MQIQGIYDEYRAKNIKGTTKVITTFLSALSRDKDSFPTMMRIYTDFYKSEAVSAHDTLPCSIHRCSYEADPPGLLGLGAVGSQMLQLYVDGLCYSATG
eukprot:scaffold104_cov375-Prasinococcus_capsulatus_cf.AAC.8